MKTDYTDINKAIMAAILGGNTRAHAIETTCYAIALKMRSNATDTPMRVIDRRLQALRRAGKIGFETSNGWYILARVSNGKPV